MDECGGGRQGQMNGELERDPRTEPDFNEKTLPEASRTLSNPSFSPWQMPCLDTASSGFF